MSGEDFFNRLFSSMCFGSMFSVWLLVTVVISLKRGWLFALSSVVGYIAVLFAVELAAWLAMVLESKLNNHDRS